jgi:hypothetical protein
LTVNITVEPERSPRFGKPTIQVDRIPSPSSTDLMGNNPIKFVSISGENSSFGRRGSKIDSSLIQTDQESYDSLMNEDNESELNVVNLSDTDRNRDKDMKKKDHTSGIDENLKNSKSYSEL